MNSWIIEEAYDRTGAEHMARDESLARERVLDSTLPNVLRLYTWSPWAISLGYQQDDSTIDRAECERRGIDIVRRPTGGRAVLHAEELTYSAIMRAESGQGIYLIHNKIVESLLASLRELGGEGSELSLTGPDSDSGFQKTYSGDRPSNIACFGSSARHEVTYRERKVIGSAQRRFGDVVLQHGSILLGDAHLMLGELLSIPNARKAAVLDLLKREATTLSEAFGRSLDPHEAASCVRRSFVGHICKNIAMAESPAVAGP